MHFVALLLQEAPNQEAIQRMVMAMIAIIPLLILIGIAIVMIPCWFILKKAGFTPWLSAVMPDSVAWNAGSALCAGVFGMEGFARTADGMATEASLSASAAGTVPAAGVRLRTESGREQMLAS